MREWHGTYKLIPQFDIDLLAEQHGLRVEVGQFGQTEGFGLHGEIRPLRVAPDLPRRVRAVVAGRGGRLVSRRPRDDGRRVLLRRVGHVFPQAALACWVCPWVKNATGAVQVGVENSGPRIARYLDPRVDVHGLMFESIFNYVEE